MTDESIIELLFSRSEKGIDEINKKYGKKCRSIAFAILGNKEDAEECVNDAYLGIWNSVPPEKPAPLSTFIYRILKNISFNKKRANETAKRKCVYEEAMEEMEIALASFETVEKALESIEIQQTIKDFLLSLGANNRVAFVRRYWYLESCAEIARVLGTSEKNVTVILTRTREKLRNFLEERGVEI